MVRARRGRWATLLLAAVGGTAGLGPVLLATAQPAWAFAHTVEISDNAYSPKVQEINKGDKVIWRMPGTKGPHSATADDGSFDYKFGAKGAQEEFRFNTPKTYSYHCTFHDGMTGTIVVTDPDAPTTTSTAPPTTAPPTTAPPTTTTTQPPTTTTTAEPTTTTTAAPRPPAEVPSPPAPNTAAAPTPATSSTTTAPPATTTTLPPAPTTSAPPVPAGDQGAAPSTSPPDPPTTEATRGTDEAAAGRPGRSDGGLDVTAVFLVSLLVAVGMFGAWTLIRVRPGRI